MNSTAVARFKLFVLLITSTVLIFIRNIYVVGFIFGLVIVASGVIKQRNSMKSRLAAILVVSVCIILFQFIFNTSLTPEQRVYTGGMTAIRLIALSISVFLFTETTSPSAIVSSLSFLPDKLTLLLTISFSLIPAIMREITAIRLVQQSRGFRAKGLGFVLPILIPLLNRTLRRAEHIAIVLQTRGFE